MRASRIVHVLPGPSAPAAPQFATLPKKPAARFEADGQPRPLLLRKSDARIEASNMAEWLAFKPRFDAWMRKNNP